MKFIWNNIILGIVVNLFIAPIAYIFRKQAQRSKGFLWTFLSDENMYGDVDWRPKLKNKFLRAYLWMIRNPRQNWYWKDYVKGSEANYTGTGKVKFGNDILSWRTMKHKETGNNHGEILDFEQSLFGKQDITFVRIDLEGNIQNCYRKSTCIPYKFLWWIILVKRRSGHENGLMQYNFTFPIYSYKKNKEGWELWTQNEWKNVFV